MFFSIARLSSGTKDLNLKKTFSVELNASLMLLGRRQRPVCLNKTALLAIDQPAFHLRSKEANMKVHRTITQDYKKLVIHMPFNSYYFVLSCEVINNNNKNNWLAERVSMYILKCVVYKFLRITIKAGVHLKAVFTPL